MDAILLPIALPTTTLREAHKQLIAAKRSGIVVQDRSEYRLYSAADIVRGLHHQVETISGLSTNEGNSPEVYPVDLPSLVPAVDGTLTLQQLSQSILSRYNYGLLASDVNGALIITRREQLRHFYEPIPVGCYCSEPDCQEVLGPGTRCPEHQTEAICWPQNK